MALPPLKNTIQGIQDQSLDVLQTLMIPLNQLSISADEGFICSQPKHALSQVVPSPLTPSLSGWNKLPPECLEIIVQVLDTDTSTLASLLQVNQQCFFLVVPRLYRDPFLRIREMSIRKSNNIRLSSISERAPQTLSILEDQPQSATNTLYNAATETTATTTVTAAATAATSTTASTMAGTMTSPAKVGVGAIKTQFDDDVSKINQILTARLEAREFALLYTLLSTFIPQLCARFPDLKEHFFPTSPFRDYCSWSREPFDFGPHHHSVTWPRQLYLRHLVVLDLEKLCTRARQSRGSCHAGRAPVVTTRRDGVFQRQFTPDRSNHNLTTIGVLDHLQRALLNQPGADRIQSMRIPTHRMRTFQLRQERVPRARERKGPPPLWQPYYPEDDEEAVAPSLEPSKSAPIEELNRPYCFTFNKLMHLRRFEVCDMTENECDWETLDRVLATLRFGHHLGKSHTEAEKTARGESVATCQLNRIQMFSLETQAPLTSHFSKVLSHFEHLEVLELKPACCQRPWFADSHPNLHRTLRVLRIGTTTFYREHTAAFEHLGQFFNLEELRIVVNSPHQFQWVVNTKKQFRLGQQQKQQQQCRSVNQVNRTGAGLGPAPITYIRDQDNPLQKCLPKLKRLGCSVEGDNQFVSVNTIIDAFGDQLEEFVVRVLNYAESSRFEHPFSQLRRLALRGDFLFRFDYESLAEQCPTLEMLALQHNRFLRSVADVQDDAAMVAALVKLTKLRCLYLEGLWPIDDIQLLKLVQERPSLYKIGIHYSENLTFAGMEQLDRILSARETKYPLKPKGLYRLPGYMSDFLAKDYVWRTTFFGHEDD